jgi:heme/copper-type cytochrome/quinol oxidase subunit 4
MKIKMNVHCYFLITLMAGMLFLGLYALTYEAIETKLMPIAVCGIGFLLVANELRKELTGEKKASDDAVDDDVQMNEEEPASTTNELRSYVAGFAWVIGLFFLAYLIGFLISTPLFVVVYMITHGRTFLASCITAAIMGGAIYGASMALQMYLFPGILLGG